MVYYIVINNFFVSFETSGGSYNPSQNTLKLINEFEKCIPSFMESLTANFIQFFSAIAKFSAIAREIGHKTMCVLNFVILLKFSHFLSHLTTHEVTRTFSL